MSKEMYISSSPHETKVAVLEDDQLVEVYFERDTDVGLVGGIYKGRVNRVLPGMQSAFVDIGLDRDAFLYVSDFFYEDQEEYEKVFEEAEARATKLTMPQSETAGTTELVASGAATEPPPAEVVAPSPPAQPAAESPAPAVPSQAAAPSQSAGAPTGAPRESHDHRPFDPRRGRRRRHRGRPDFAEGRHGDRRFPPPYRSEEPSTETHEFQILPGETLAKYSHLAGSAAEEAEVTPPAESGPALEQEPIQSDMTPLSASMSERDDEPALEDSPAVQAYGETDNVPSGSQPASSLDEAASEAAEAAPTASAEVSSHAPVAALSGVVTESMPALAPGETPASVASTGPEVVSGDVGEVPTDAPATHPDRETAIPASPSTPSYPEEVAASPSVEGPASLLSGEPEPQQAGSAAAPVLPTESESPSERAEGSTSEPVPQSHSERDEQSPSERAELDDLEEVREDEDAAEEEYGAEGSEDELAEGVEAEALAEGEPAEGEVVAGAEPGSEGEAQPVGSEARVGDAAGSETPGDRTYTLREPHQRPRFAPRRRRGRRGPGGGPRRFDRPGDSSRPGNHHPVQIAEVLKEGQEILVQIAKEPLGTKGARITSHVALPGRYLVYMPTIEHIGVSRKIVSEEERLRLRNIIMENRGSLTGGFIVRTAGQGRTDEEFKADLKFLSTLWNEIRAKADRLRAPALLHCDLDLVQRLLRDLLTPDFKLVRVDSEIDYERVLDFVSRCQPALVGKVKLYSRDTPLFEEFGIQQEIDKALKPKVWLKSGGYIVINQTEALVAVDVNTGKFVGKTNRLEDTIVKTNVDAVNEIVRQVRLRDLGGIIVIDFIDMDERKNRAKVVQALEEALRADRAPTKVISFHDFGLVAVTRKRVKQSLERSLCEPCSYCSGSGWVKSVNTVCKEILAEARKMAKGIDGDTLTLRVSPEVAKALKSREGGLVSELESITKKDVIVKSDAMVHQERFEIF